MFWYGLGDITFGGRSFSVQPHLRCIFFLSRWEPLEIITEEDNYACAKTSPHRWNIIGWPDRSRRRSARRLRLFEFCGVTVTTSGPMAKFNYVAVSVLVAVAVVVYRTTVPGHDARPEIMTEDVWWGRTSERTATGDDRIREFRINITDKVSEKTHTHTI